MFIIYILLLPFLPFHYILTKFYEDFLGKDAPLNGMGMLVVGVPIGFILWVGILYECFSHISIHIS